MGFKSLVVVDVETTDVWSAKITEIAMCAVEVEHIEGAEPPRVVHQFSMCVNPKKRIQLGASNVSGLYNVQLANVPPMNGNLIEGICAFLSHIPKPICLVAHNGNKFDFPLIQQEIFSKSSLKDSDELYIVDSLGAFREILCNKVATRQIQPEAPESTTRQRVPSQPLRRQEPVPPELMDSEEDEICLKALQKYEASLECGACQLVAQNAMQIEQEQDIWTQSTQVPSCSNMKTPPPSSALAEDESFLTQAPKKPRRTHDMLRDGPARRALSFVADLPESKVAQSPNSRQPKSYKLEDIHEFLVGRPIVDAHRAMGDCLALLRCICRTQTAFMDYARQHAILFSEFQTD